MDSSMQGEAKDHTMAVLGNSVNFDHTSQHFVTANGKDVDALAASMDRPLSLTLQLTRNCNFKCVYCSEPPGIRARSLDHFLSMIDKLVGMRRIILSGGEPMISPHFWTILEYCRSRFEIVVLSTNASRIDQAAAVRLKPLVDYVDVTVDGPRKQHDAIRGHYSDVIRGLTHLSAQQIPLSVICVYLPGNRDVVHYICHTGDIFGAIKVKILTPIPKGNSTNIFTGFVPQEELEALRAFLATEKERNGWKIRITISDWTRIGRGHAILVEPDGRAIASPDWEHDDCLLPFGNLADEPVETVWGRYPYKRNHLAKYFEDTLIVL